MKLDTRDYVPILKSKAGELWAIGNLHQNTRPHVLPLFELHDHDSLPPTDHGPDLCTKILNVWSNPCYLDTIWLNGESGDGPVISAVLNEARNLGLPAIPVAHVTYGTAALDAIRTAVIQDGNGCLLRVSPDVSALVIQTVANYVGATDILLDYQGHPMTLAQHIPQLPNLSTWRNVIAGAGAFPSVLSSLPRGVWNAIPRHDWNGWLNAVTGGQLLRNPNFSDYGIRSPGVAPSFGDPSSNIKYTGDSNWQVQLRGRLQAGNASDMIDICVDLVPQAFYSGPQVSAGDQCFDDLATGVSTRHGGGQQWVQWSMSHHLEFVVNQLQSYPGI